MNRILLGSLAALLLLTAAQPVAAHFPWIATNAAGEAIYFFGENPADRTYKLPPTIAKAEIGKLMPEGAPLYLKLAAVEKDDLVGLVSTEKVGTDATLISKVTFGIYQGSRLNYYTLYQGGKLPAQRSAYEGRKVPLDLRAELVDTDSGVDAFVIWKEKPLADTEVHLYSGEGHEEGTAKTDQDGKVSFTDKQVADGLNGIMLGHTVKDEKGEFNGKAYQANSHYLSVTFLDPESPTTTKVAGSSAGPSAESLRLAAHNARSVWKNFPGFTANVTVSENGKNYAGKLSVSDNFENELSIDEAAQQPWVKDELRSLINHRKPGTTTKFNVEFADNEAEHVAGRLIAEKDGSGKFRIKNGLIQEVLRRSDSHWIEITNLEQFRTHDGHYLPQTTSVTYRDPKTGDVQSNRSNRFTWKRVGDFYLPEQSLTIEVGNDGARTISNLTFTNHQLNKRATVATDDAPRAILHKPLREPLTSFGAAVLGDYLYVFSGHDGAAEGFGKDLLANHFRRIKFDDPQAEWEDLAPHDPAQSTALLSDGKFIYRTGGLTFLNKAEEKTNFNSTDHFARYDVEKNEWTKLAPLPEPRSSLDAAVVGRSIYVVGGWNLQGESSSTAPWHDTMVRFDLDNPSAGWRTLPGPGYNTRALSVAAHNDKLYVIGGIQEKGFTRKVSIYDPATKVWSEGPELRQDSATSGFATSSFATGGRLYQTGASGMVYRLSEDGKEWEGVERLFFPRMFLRLLPISDNRLIALGGTATGAGRMSVVESLHVDQPTVGAKSTRWSIPFGGRAKQGQVLIQDGMKLYAIGGNASRKPHDFSKEMFVNEAYLFDIPAKSVEKLPNAPIPLQSGAGAMQSRTSEHRTLVVAGGLGFGKEEFGSLNEVLEFDPKEKTWSTSAVRLPEPRSMLSAVQHDDALWMFGGSGAGHGRGLATSVLHWWGDETPVVAVPNVAIPTPRRSFGGAVVANEYYMVGGLTAETGIAETVDVFNFETRSWRTVAAPQVPRVFPSLAATKEKLYLFGGFTRVDGHFAPANSLEAFDLKSGQWQTIADELPGAPNSMSLLTVADRLLFYGIDKQVDGQANFVLYDPTPTTLPAVVEAMSFGGPGGGAGGRGGREDSTPSAKALMRRDLDLDGKLTADELGARLKSLLEEGDKDGDKQLSFEEVKAALQARDAPQQTKAEPKAG